MIILAICATSGIIYYKNKNNFKAINIKEVKSVTLYPFQGAVPTKKAYNYDTENSKDMKVINNIIYDLNTGKSLGEEKGVIALNGGTPEHLVIDLSNGQYIDISTTGASADQVLVSQSSADKTYIVYSPKLRRLFMDELQRIFNS